MAALLAHKELTGRCGNRCCCAAKICVCSTVLEQNGENGCSFHTREMFGSLVLKLCLVLLLLFVKVAIQAACYKCLLEMKQSAV